MENSIRKTTNATPISVDKLYVGEYQKEGTKTAQLRQVIKTVSYYPSKQIKNDLQDNPFALADFGFAEQEFTNEENRVCWIDVPFAVASIDDVIGKIPSTSCLYRIMSNHPILTSNQAYAIQEGLRTMDEFADSQVVRYGENHAKEGQLILDDNNKPQYRSVFFSMVAKEDVDNRNSVADDFYASQVIQSEMTGENVVAGQALVGN